ncbi:MAG: hypothetical protein HY535_07305 [Chloroflexi bacterium]|nr:hypothetical protein [Chloroflexota bacterium]
MTGRRALAGASLAAVLVLALGLAAGVWQTPANLYRGGAPFTATPVALSAVVLAGLVDGINPCAFTVLLLFAAAIASTYRGLGDPGAKTARTTLLLYGGAFILAIFGTYLALGLGLLRASAVLTQNHVGARVGALASVLLGLWMLKDFFLPGWGPRLGAPGALGDLVHRWGQRASLVTMLGLGTLVGLCTVPCSGAVYLAVLSMLALQESFLRSYLYLLLYNVMFVVPLVAILGAASARPTLNRLAHWNLRHRERVRVGLGGTVVAVGLAILATV